MNRQRIFVVLCLCGWIIPLFSWFNQLRTDFALEKKEYDKAHALITQSLIDNPGKISALYNAGQLAYEKDDFEVAHAYFEAAAQQEDGPMPLHLQAWYQAGNSSVQQKKWQQALVEFKNVLKIDPTHEHAKKMIEQLEKLMAEKEKEKEDQKSKSQESDKESAQDGQDQESGQSDKDQESQTGAMDQKHDQTPRSRDEKERTGDEKNDQKDRKDSEQNHMNKDTSKNTKKQPAGNSSSSAHKEESGAKNDQSSDAASAPGSGVDSHPQNTPQGLDKEAENKPKDRQEMLLQLAEGADGQATKALMMQQVMHQEKGSYGQKNW